MVTQKTHEIFIDEIHEKCSEQTDSKNVFLNDRKSPIRSSNAQFDGRASPYKANGQTDIEDKIQRFEDLNRLAFFKTYLEHRH